MTKVVVIGLDGATWSLVKPLVDVGELPVIGKLLKNGAWGDLESCVPYSTYPAWKCYSTGKNPGKLGVYSWFIFDKRERRIKYANSLSFKSEEIWDILGIKGKKVGIINMPTSYPPKKVNGFMISGFNALNDLEYTYPKSLKNRLKKKYNYKINPDHHLRLDLEKNYQEAMNDKKKALLEIKELIKSRFDVAIDLFLEEKPDFLHLTIFYIDSAQHYFWKEMEDKCSEFHDVLKDLWKLIDRGIGKLISELDKDTVVILMSDHGFTRLESKIHVNVWLKKNGYLTLQEDNKHNGTILFKLLKKLKINQQKAIKLRRSIIGRIAIKLLPFDFLSSLWFKIGTSTKDKSIVNIFDKIYWEETKAIMIEDGIIRIVGKNKEKIRNKLIKELSDIKNPKNNEYIFENVYPGNEIYTGKYLPEIVLHQKSGYSLDSTITSDDSIFTFETEDGYTGYHELNGIFLAYGKSIRRNHFLQKCKIYDIAPTILHMLDLPIPNDMDGRILTEIFEEDSEFAK